MERCFDLLPSARLEGAAALWRYSRIPDAEPQPLGAVTTPSFGVVVAVAGDSFGVVVAVVMVTAAGDADSRVAQEGSTGRQGAHKVQCHPSSSYR